MDDTEDDARYPPDPYPANHYHHHRSPSSFPTSARTKMPSRNAPFPSPQMGRRYPNDEEEVDSEEEEDGEEELNGADRAMEEAEDEDDDDEDGGGGPGYRRARTDESSPYSRGKRRKLDKHAMGFEFAPRPALSPPPSAAATASRPSGRNNPTDWSEDSTFVLLDAWGRLYILNGRKNLRFNEWLTVAKKVNETSRTPRSDAQCRNRLDTLKKKYKDERARMAQSGNSSSKWVYFKKMEKLMGKPPPSSSTAARQLQRLQCGVDFGEFIFTNSSRPHLNRSNELDEMRDSPAGSEPMGDDDEDDDSDGLPPPSVQKNRGSLDLSSFRMLAESIQKFGEVYEKMENSKRQHMAELEKMRRQFHRDLEDQKRQILERAQAELEKISQEEGDDEEDRDDEEGDVDNNGHEVIDSSTENFSS